MSAPAAEEVSAQLIRLARSCYSVRPETAVRTIPLTQRLLKPSPPQDDPIDEEALSWFTRLLDGPSDENTRREFAAWCAQNPKNRENYERIAAFWNSESFTEAVNRDAESFTSEPARRPKAPAYALAFAATLLLGIWTLFQVGWIDRLQADHYTAIGELRKFELPDGSRVQLDTDSAIALDYRESRRAIRLLRGRAFFAVQPDPARPFEVASDNGLIQVVGTRFSVDTAGNIPLRVEQGQVQYRPTQGGEFTLSAGTQIRERSGAATVTPIAHPDTAFQWTQGRLIFRNRRFSEVAERIDRYYAGTIMIANPNIEKLRVTGNYKLDDPAQVIQSLARASGVRVSQFGNYLTIFY